MSIYHPKKGQPLTSKAVLRIRFLGETGTALKITLQVQQKNRKTLKKVNILQGFLGKNPRGLGFFSTIFDRVQP